MELTKALNYMKIIIDRGKQRHNKVAHIKEGLNDYLKLLSIEDVLSSHDCEVLKGVIKHTDNIMNSTMTVDEAFVRSLCNVEKVKYTTLKSEKGQVVQPEIEKSKPQPIKSSTKVTKKQKPKEDSYEPPRFRPIEVFTYQPTGSCGRIEEALKEEARKEWYERNYGTDDGIWGKCRH